MTVIPLDDRILVRPAEALSENGRPDTTVDHIDDRPIRGTVIAAGTGTLDGAGQITPLTVQAGDTILFPRYLGCEVTFGGLQYWILKADDILNIEVRAVTVALLRSRHLRSSRSPRRDD
jgi:chaperonin GroES